MLVCQIRVSKGLQGILGEAVVLGTAPTRPAQTGSQASHSCCHPIPGHRLSMGTARVSADSPCSMFLQEEITWCFSSLFSHSALEGWILLQGLGGNDRQSTGGRTRGSRLRAGDSGARQWSCLPTAPFPV